MVVTLDNPAALNAMNPTMRSGIMAAIDRADADDSVRAIIVTGAGRGFCAGADMSKGTASFVPPVDDGPYRDGGGILVRRLLDSTKPIIGAINGPAAGIGASMTLAMDFRVVSESARFGFVYAQRGIGPEGCSSWLLPLIVGPTRALAWLLTGRVFDAAEALAGGLATEVVSPERLLERAYEIARLIADRTAPLSVALTRELVWGQLARGAAERAHALESVVVPWLSATPDAAEGVAAFLEKRPPSFVGRPSEQIPADLLDAVWAV